MGSLSVDISRGGISPSSAQAINGRVASGLVAAGTTLTNALSLTSTVNHIGTVSGGTGVSLYPMAVGDEMEVYNGGANALNVYPAFASVAINAGVAGAPLSLAISTKGKFRQVTSSQITAINPGSGTGGGESFTQVFVSGSATVVASVSDTLSIIAGTNITLTANATAKTVQIDAASTSPAVLAWPTGSIFMSTRSTSPAILLGFGTWAALEAQFLVGVKAGDPDFGVGASGGATGVTAVGSISQPVFTGDLYTPSGSNSTLTYTPSGTIDMTLYVPNGTNAASTFTPTGTVAFPASVPTFAGTTVTATASVNWPTAKPTFAGEVVTASASVNWPTGKPVFAGVSSSAHQHGIPFIHTGTNTLGLALVSSVWGVGTTAVPVARITATGSATMASVVLLDATGSGAVLLSQTAGSTVPAGTVAWPASVPQAVMSFSASGSIAWPGSVPQAVASMAPAGIITWPSGNPSFTGTAGTVPAQVFTGATGSGSAIFAGITATLSAQTFTGIAKAATGTVSKPTFTGDKGSNLPPYRTVYMWERTA